MTIDAFFDYLEMYSTIIPLITFLLKRPKKSKWINVLLYYCITSIPLSMYANYLYYCNRNNIIVYFIIGLNSFCSFIFLFEDFLKQKKMTGVNRIVILFTFLFFVFNIIWGEGSSAINSASHAVGNSIILVYCFYFYKLQLQDPKNIFVEKQPSFWIVSGIFIYSGGVFFLFTLYHPLTLAYKDFANIAWDINDTLILVMNILFAKGVACASQQ